MDNKIEEQLSDELTLGYKPNMPLEAMWLAGTDMPQITLRRDIEFMQMHPIVIVALEYYKSGISSVEFWGGPNPLNADDPHGEPVCQDPRVAKFILATAEKLWHNCVPLLQEGGYPYGWAAGEHVYTEVNGYMTWSHTKDVHPNDAFVLSQDYRPIGIRIKGMRNRGPVDLWFACNSIPAKACWYPHKARFGHFYGRSQLIGAWRPWRRLGWRDGVEQVIDAAIYRGGYSGPIVKHPPEDMQTAKQGIPATQTDGAGNSRRSARDVARQMVEWAKAGAGFTMSSAHYPAQMGGGSKWEITWPTQVMDVMPLVEAARYIEDQIFYGIGVPPELIRASGTGSGYSGRNIPREAFLCSQQHVADAILKMFVEQIIRPLVLTNYGAIPFNIACKSLLQTQAKEKIAPIGGGGAANTPRDTHGRFLPKGTQGPTTGSTVNPGGNL